jgi:hypothetical protein
MAPPAQHPRKIQPSGRLYFNDEGVDCWQRSNQLGAYYHQVLEPAGEIPIVAYPIFPIEMKARGRTGPTGRAVCLKWLDTDPAALG